MRRSLRVALRLGVIAAASGATLAVSCIDDLYTCSSDGDCNVGIAGRCEIDHYCSTLDDTCPLGRRYTAHSGARSGTCFDDSRLPLDVCAPGQPPAPADTTDPCASAVCAALPTCCTTAWSEACVQQAQLHHAACAATCDTRIAVTAAHSITPGTGTIELYTVTYSGGKWTGSARTDRAEFLDYLAPAPGQTTPRLAGLDSNRLHLMIDDIQFAAVATDRDFDGAYSVDFDRDGRDTCVLASYNAPDGLPNDILKLDTGDTRPIAMNQSVAFETFGDYDADHFPDAISTQGAGTTYQLMQNTDDSDPTGARRLDMESTQTIGAVVNGGGANIRALDFSDLDGDGLLDMIAFGGNVQLHFGVPGGHLSDQPGLRIDCTPPIKQPTACQYQAYTGAALPRIAGGASVASLVVGIDDVAGVGSGSGSGSAQTTSESRNLYRIDLAGSGFGSAVPLWQDGTPTPPLRAIATRDVDGDGVLDVIAIDGHLQVWYARGNPDGSLATMPSLVLQLQGMSTTDWAIVRMSVSGAPSP